MSKSRRHFLNTSLGLIGSTAACSKKQPKTAELPAGAPPAFGTAPAVGPQVSPSTFAEAEKLVQFELTPAERSQAAGNWRNSLASVYERRVGPRKITLEPAVAPWSRCDPAAGQTVGPDHDRFVRSTTDRKSLPAADEDIAYAPLTQLSRWIEERKLTSERLTHIYLDRLERFNPKLRCVITLTRDLALMQSKIADDEIARGKYRGPL